MGRLLKLSVFRRRGLALALTLACVGLIGALFFAYSIELPERLELEDSKVVEYSNGKAAYVFLSEDDKLRIAPELDRVDPDFIEALIALEDKRFYYHPGVDPIAVFRALATNTFKGRRVSGASTITMQLVRLLEPRPRTYFSKLVEVFRAVQLELNLSKDEILLHYLRFAPYGRNIEGIEAASYSYFGASAKNLTAAQRATLLAVPQSPNRRYPSPENIRRLEFARNAIAERLLAEGLLERTVGHEILSDADALAQITRESVPGALQDIPREMPHLAQWLTARHPERARLQTHIDLGVQHAAQDIAARWGEAARSRGISHGGILVVEHATGEIKAAVGNLSYDRSEPGSHIAFFDVVRSPGSVLKPFIFAMAIDEGIAHPRMLVEDIPSEARAWQPQNFDDEFDGLVRLDHALSRSLNMPFIHLLNTLSVPEFLATLRRMEAKHLEDDPGYYGLSAAVGGVDVTALEILGMFSTLAQNGTYKPVRLIEDERTNPDSWRVFSDEAAWLTRRTLEVRDRPDAVDRRLFNPHAGRIHWKTGTSFGNRDAWAAGSGRNYTALVWFGNLDHRPNHALVGAERAGPVLFDVLEAIEFGELEADPEPEGMTEVEVCSYSGHIPTKACGSRTTARAPRRSVPSTRCPFHTRIDVDRETGLALTPHCRGDKSYRSESFVVWPARLRRYVDARMRARSRVPDLHPDCKSLPRGSAPIIVSPPHSHRLVLMKGRASESQQIPLEAEASFAAERLDWFVNGELVGSAAAQDSVWWTPQPGVHEIVVSDAAGRSAKRTLEVR